jgi:hypothetical protein
MEINFSYEENENFSNKLVKILFNYNHSLINNRNEDNLKISKKIMVIEILTNPNDKLNKDLYYLSNSYKDYIQSFYFSNKFNEILANYPYSLNSFDKDNYKEIISIVNQSYQIFDNLKQRFFHKTQMEEVSKEFSNIFTDILNKFPKEKSEFNEKNVFEKNLEFKRALYLKQILLYKLGFIDLIINCWNFIHEHHKYLHLDDNNQSSDEKTDTLEIIYNKMIDTLSYVTTENQMIYEILLTRTYIRKIKSISLTTFYQFYIEILKKLRNMENTVFVIPLIIEIEKDINLNDVFIDNI